MPQLQYFLLVQNLVSILVVQSAKYSCGESVESTTPFYDREETTQMSDLNGIGR